MAFPTDIDAVPVFQASDTLVIAQHHALHTSILDRVFQIQNFLGGSPGTETGGSMRLRLKTAETTIASHTASIANAQVPVGTILAYGGTGTNLSGWKLCTGIAHGSSALKTVLAEVVGSGAASDITPDLRDKFILGKGGSLPASGGVQQVTLSAAQSGLPAHNHGASATATNTDHLHRFGTNYMDQNNVHTHDAWTGGGGDHVHQVHLLEGSAGAGDGAGIDSGAVEGWNGYGANGETYGGQGAHNHPVGIGGTDINHTHQGWTDGTDRASAQSHTHTIYTSNNAAVAATTPVNVMNPYYALVYIIKT